MPDLYLFVKVRNRVPGDDSDTFFAVPYSVPARCDHKTHLCRDCLDSWAKVRVFHVDRPSLERSPQAQVTPTLLDGLERLGPSSTPATQSPLGRARLSRGEDPAAAGVALDLTRTISTLDQVTTWMRDLLAAGFPVDPETSGKDIIDVETQSRTFTPAGAAAYDRIWTQCWAVTTELTLDINALAITVMKEHETRLRGLEAAQTPDEEQLSRPEGNAGLHQKDSHSSPDTGEVAPRAALSDEQLVGGDESPTPTEDWPSHGNAEITQPRMAIYVDQTMLTPHGYVPAVVFENEPGYYRLTGNGEMAQPWYWGHDLAAAKALAREANTDLGLSPREVQQIVASSIAASLTQDPSQKPSDERWRSIRGALSPRPQMRTSQPSQSEPEPESTEG